MLVVFLLALGLVLSLFNSSLIFRRLEERTLNDWVDGLFLH